MGIFGKLVAGVGVLLLMLPTPVLVAIGLVIAILAVVTVVARLTARAAKQREERERRRKEDQARLARERAAAVSRQQQEAERQRRQELDRRAKAVAAAKRRTEERARAEDKRLVDAYGKRGAERLRQARSSVQQLVSTEAARAGWLGDVEFESDLEEIDDNLRKMAALRLKVDELSALPKLDNDDRNLVTEAKASVALLERKIDERVKLLDRCASEAHRIDESLRNERDAARFALAREKLHGELAAMIYGVESAAASPTESASDAAITRVQAYQEIKGELERARVDGDAAIDGTNESCTDDSSASWVSPIRSAWKWVTE